MLTPVICISEAIRVRFPINPIATPSKSNSGAAVESFYFTSNVTKTGRHGSDTFAVGLIRRWFAEDNGNTQSVRRKNIDHLCDIGV